MDNLSLGLKKLIFSKRDASAPGSNPRSGRERSHAHKFGKNRPRRDCSPFEEVKADSIEMVEKTEEDFDEEELRDKEDGYNKHTEYRPRDMSGFEEIDWPEIDGHCEKPTEYGTKEVGLGSEESSEFKHNAAVHAKQQEMESPDAQEVQETNKEQKGDHKLEDHQAMTPGDEDIPIRPVMYGTPSMSESIEAELDDVEWRTKAKRHEPITREQFMGYFDCDGRIVDENELRRTIFKGGVEQDIRKEVWQFLYELYPCNSTIREREVMKTEHRIRYEALKTRWHPVLRQISQDVSLGVHFCPEWLRKKRTAKQLHYEVERPTETIAELDENNEGRLNNRSDFGSKEGIDVEEVITESQEAEREIEKDKDFASEGVENGFDAEEGAEINFDSVSDCKLIKTENVEDSSLDIEENLNGKMAVKTAVALCNEAVAEVHGRTSEDIKEAIQDAMLEEPQSGKKPNVNETLAEETEQDSVTDEALLISNNVEELHMNSKPLVHYQDETVDMESNVSPVTANGFYYVETEDMISPRDGMRIQKMSNSEEADNLLNGDEEMLNPLESQSALMVATDKDVIDVKIRHDQISNSVRKEEIDSPFFQEISSEFQDVPEKDYFEANGIESNLQELSADEDLNKLTDNYILKVKSSTVNFQENLIDFQESEETGSSEKENRREDKKNSSDFSDTEVDLDPKQEEIIPENDLFDSMKNYGINPFQEIDPEVENSLFESQEQELCFDESEGEESINTSALDEDFYSKTSPKVCELNSTEINPFNDSTSFLEESQREVSENFHPEVSNTEVDLSALQQDINISMQDNTVLSEFMSCEDIQQFDEGAPHADTVYGTEQDSEKLLVDLGTDDVIGHVDNADQLEGSGTAFRYADDQLDLIAFSPIESHSNTLSHPATKSEEDIKLKAGSLSPTEPHPEQVDLMTVRPDGLEREAEGRPDQELEVRGHSPVRAFSEQRSKVAGRPDSVDFEREADEIRDQELEVTNFSPIRAFSDRRSKVTVRPDSLNFGKQRERQPEQVGAMPPWLAQQLKASSPAGTKMTKTIHIHEGGVPAEEDTTGIVPLREIAEKASLEVKKRLIEQGQNVPRSSTPVEFSKNENGHRKVCEETINQKENIDVMDSNKSDFVHKKILQTGSLKDNRPSKIEGDVEYFDCTIVEKRNLNRVSSRDSDCITGDHPYRQKLKENNLVQIAHKKEANAEESSVSDSSLLTGISNTSNRQGDMESAEHRVRFDNEVFEGTAETVDPETGEFKDTEIKSGPREKRNNSKRSGSVGEIIESTDQVIPRITQPKNNDTLRKSYSAANIRDYPGTESPDIGTFNLLKNLEESISKSDSDVYKAEQRRAPSPYRDLEQYKHESCKYCCGDMESSQDFPDGFGDDLKQYIEIQAKVNAGRQVFDVEVVSQALRIIDKDVPRTDRELPYFRGNENPNLLKLRDALITYSFYHPDVGYAQGMNDVMSRFFVVMESEAEAYWMFCNYMEHFKGDFMEKDMLRKISLVEQLLMKMDRGLYDFFQELQMELIFCHRWLLLSFKREFSYEDGLRIFEIMSSRHLEVSSVEAEMERSRERARELEKDEGSRMEEIYVSPEYSFDVFVCVAMLHECRDLLMSTNDMANVYQIMTSLPQVNDLDTILSKAEDLFFKYCRKSTMDCFQLIDEEPAEKIVNWKQRLHLDF